MTKQNHRSLGMGKNYELPEGQNMIATGNKNDIDENNNTHDVMTDNCDNIMRKISTFKMILMFLFVLLCLTDFIL